MNRTTPHHHTLFVLITAVLLCLSISACKPLAGLSEKGTFSFTFDAALIDQLSAANGAVNSARSANARAALTNDSLITWNVTVRSSKSRQYEQTLTSEAPVALSSLKGKTITFTGIPVNIECYAEASFSFENAVVFKGISTSFTLTESSLEKDVSITLIRQSEPNTFVDTSTFTTPYVLMYNPQADSTSSNNLMNFSKRYNNIAVSEDLETFKTYAFSTGATYQPYSYCMDETENLWTTNYANIASSYGFTQWKKTGVSTSEGNYIHDGQTANPYYDTDYDYIEQNIYTLYYKNGTGFQILVNQKDSTNYNDTDTTTYTITGTYFNDPQYSISGGTVLDGKYYLYGLKYDDKRAWVAKTTFDESTKTFTIDNITYIDTFSELMLENITYSQFKITDMKAQGNKVYALFNQIYKYGATLIQRGGILVFRDDGEELVYEQTVGLTPVNNLTFQKEVLIDSHPVFIDNQGTPYIRDIKLALGLPLKDKIGQYFCVPQKFVGTKPKKLVFADNGTCIYVEDDTVKSELVSRIVEVDLETFSFTSHTINDSTYKFNEGTSFNFSAYSTEEVEKDAYYSQSGGTYSPYPSNTNTYGINQNFSVSINYRY